MSKYTNADTSPERLKKIKQSIEGNNGSIWEEYSVIRDLLAMLEERDEMIRDENIPRTYRTLPNTKGPLYCIWGTSSNSYADELEKQLLSKESSP